MNKIILTSVAFATIMGVGCKGSTNAPTANTTETTTTAAPVATTSNATEATTSAATATPASNVAPAATTPAPDTTNKVLTNEERNKAAAQAAKSTSK